MARFLSCRPTPAQRRFGDRATLPQHREIFFGNDLDQSSVIRVRSVPVLRSTLRLGVVPTERAFSVSVHHSLLDWQMSAVQPFLRLRATGHIGLHDLVWSSDSGSTTNNSRKRLKPRLNKPETEASVRSIS